MCNQVQCVIFTSAKLIVFSLVFVCLFVSRIMQHLLERFSQNLMEGVGRGKKPLYIRGYVDHVTLALGSGYGNG